MRARSVVAIAAVFCLPLTACSDDIEAKESGKPTQSASVGSGGDTSNATPTPSVGDSAPDDVAALKTAALDFARARIENDISGYDLLSRRCQVDLSKADFKALSENTHSDYRHLTMQNIWIYWYDDDRTQISIRGNDPEDIGKYPGVLDTWIREDDAWHWDDC
ncbi:hypothetical protein ACFYPK_28155 [Streptomyces halstedii]|uniref:hypothetical protein n=1 Tax=Streptomyces halstedii TaxID=1944 RepID=UPI00335BC24B